MLQTPTRSPSMSNPFGPGGNFPDRETPLTPRPSTFQEREIRAGGMNMKKKFAVNSLVGTVLVLAALAVFASSLAKIISIDPSGVKCTWGKDWPPITCTRG